MTAPKTKNDPPPPPPDWPPQAEEDYQRVRVLGAGAFGQVFLAKRKPGNTHCPDEFVAIKGVSIVTENEEHTAEREIAILSELQHPNVIKLIDAYDPVSEAKGRYIVMSYINGPDVGNILEKRGALGLPLVNLVARDLISAVSYLHTRGVIHRDIKPDNIMLKGCKEGKKWIDDDIMWDDGKALEKAIQKGRFKAILVDFGFARANNFGKELDSRQQSRMMMKMSAIGTQHFAAPELVSSVCNKDDEDDALTSCVSSYGLNSDAYSVGVTLKEVATGVPPGEDPTKYLKENKKPMPKRKSKFAKMISGPPKGPYVIQLRSMQELPTPLSKLISSLMHFDPNIRLSVREAQDDDYIGGYDSLEHGDVESSQHSTCVPLTNGTAFK